MWVQEGQTEGKQTNLQGNRLNCIRTQGWLDAGENNHSEINEGRAGYSKWGKNKKEIPEIHN